MDLEDLVMPRKRESLSMKLQDAESPDSEFKAYSIIEEHADSSHGAHSG